MPDTTPTPPSPKTGDATLHLLCGKIAAGKSTLAGQLAAQPGTILISEDDWLAGLFGPEMRTVQDYVQFSARLRSVIAPHIEALLRQGLSVVLDFPANTRRNREWMREIFSNAQSRHCLHVLDVPDAICKARLETRNAQGDHAFAPSAEQFDHITRYFEEPTAAEGFTIVRYPHK